MLSLSRPVYLLGLLLSSVLQSKTLRLYLQPLQLFLWLLQLLTSYKTLVQILSSPLFMWSCLLAPVILSHNNIYLNIKKTKNFHLIYISFLSTVSKIKTITYKVFFLFYRSWTCYSPFFLKNIFTLLFVFHLPGHSSLIHLVIPYNPATSIYCCVPGIFRISYYLSECKFR